MNMRPPLPEQSRKIGNTKDRERIETISEARGKETRCCSTFALRVRNLVPVSCSGHKLHVNFTRNLRFSLDSCDRFLRSERNTFFVILIIIIFIYTHVICPTPSARRQWIWLRHDTSVFDRFFVLPLLMCSTTLTHTHNSHFKCN